MPNLTRKVLVYVVQGGKLLVFRHVAHPDAGIQVPAGTIEPAESAHDAARREVLEESGLAVRIDRLIGSTEVSMAPFGRDEVQERWVFLAFPETNAPATWRHWERNASGGGEYEFEFFWHPIGAPIELAGGQGELIEPAKRALAATWRRRRGDEPWRRRGRA